MLCLENLHKVWKISIQIAGCREFHRLTTRINPSLRGGPHWSKKFSSSAVGMTPKAKGLGGRAPGGSVHMLFFIYFIYM